MRPELVFLGGLVVIVLGSEMLLRGATRIAGLLSVPPLLIGLTVVSVGTSSPELAVGIAAVYEGKGPLAVGNIAGTNLFNILFILGLSAALRPLPVHQLGIRLDVPVMIVTALVLIAMAADGVLGRFEGGLLVLGSVVYTAALVRASRRESSRIKREFAEAYALDSAAAVARAPVPPTPLWLALWNISLLVGGIALTVLGAQLMIDGASSLAKALGWSDAFIGLTIVAIGTSAPELATTLLATWKGDRDVAVGNLIGSSIYNVLVILGITCMLAPRGVDVSEDVLLIDLPLAALVAIVCLPVFRSERRISRGEGLLFVAAYLVYLATLLGTRTGS